MKFRPLKQAPVLITSGILVVVCGVRVLELDFFEHLERTTYDLRVRLAGRFPSPASTNLGFVFISDESIAAVNRGLLGRSYGLYWPRHIYGRMFRELAAQEAEAVAFDVLFADLRTDHGQVPVSAAQWPEIESFLATLRPGEAPASYTDGDEKMLAVDSDDYFAWQLRRGNTAILAAEGNTLPAELFATNAAALGDIAADRDSDGVLRRARAFRDYRIWDRVLLAAASGTDVDLSKTRVSASQLEFFTGSGRPALDGSGKPVTIKLNERGEFDAAEHLDQRPPSGERIWRKPFTTMRVWHMGIVLAAQELKLDLAAAEVDLAGGRIVLRGANGVHRTIPVDQHGYFNINWELTTGDRRLTQEAIESLLEQDQVRTGLRRGTVTNRWAGKLAVVGSSATGNDLTDRGATPLEKDAFLVAKHWNVANSVLTGRFVRRTPLATELLLIVVMGGLTAFLTWQFRVFTASGGTLALAVVYCAFGSFLYVQYRYWLPLVFPVAVGMLCEHVCLMTYRVVFEQKERRRVKSIFSKVVAPDVMHELLRAEKLSLGGARREVTVLFADIRGFTELADYSQQLVTDYVRQNHLSPKAAAACYDEFAAETLATVNAYLTCVIDAAAREKGTFDKLIGDCVMFFWGAPLEHPRQVQAAVRAAMAAQKAIHQLNQERAAENPRREIENRARASAGLPPKPPLATLMLGTGINTGVVTAGIMGSDKHSMNYTVFGREVNLASRLEGMSGRGRIFVGEATHQLLQRDDPELAATCVEREPMTPKGFNKPVRIFEVPWLPPGETPQDFQTVLFGKPAAATEKP